MMETIRPRINGLSASLTPLWEIKRFASWLAATRRSLWNFPRNLHKNILLRQHCVRVKKANVFLTLMDLRMFPQCSLCQGNFLAMFCIKYHLASYEHPHSFSFASFVVNASRANSHNRISCHNHTLRIVQRSVSTLCCPAETACGPMTLEKKIVKRTSTHETSFYNSRKEYRNRKWTYNPRIERVHTICCHKKISKENHFTFSSQIYVSASLWVRPDIYEN